jgi:hypothetical protein
MPAGTTTSYTVNGLSPSNGCPCTVVAKWGAVASSPSAELTATALDPPLDGDQQVSVRVLSAPGGDASPSVGDHWDETWTFTPSCSGTACSMSVSLTEGSSYEPWNFTVPLRGSGSRYSGTTSATDSMCGRVPVTNTITLTIAATTAASAMARGPPGRARW